jgi:hypothetical protein
MIWSCHIERHHLRPCHGWVGGSLLLQDVREIQRTLGYLTSKISMKGLSFIFYTFKNCDTAGRALERQRQADFWVRGQPGLQSEFQDSQGYTEKPCLENPKKKKKLWHKYYLRFFHVKVLGFDLGVYVHAYNLHTQEGETGELTRLRLSPALAT